MTTNILALPKISMSIDVSTNEDMAEAIQYFYPDGVTPIDLSGISFELMARDPVDPTIVILHLSSGGGGISTGGAGNSVLAFGQPAAAMASIPPGAYSFDGVARADGKQRDCVLGLINVRQGITR
jgi:hypothetical protein